MLLATRSVFVPYTLDAMIYLAIVLMGSQMSQTQNSTVLCTVCVICSHVSFDHLHASLTYAFVYAHCMHQWLA